MCGVLAGVLLGRDLLFRSRYRQWLRNRIAVITDKALEGVEWVEGKQVISASGIDKEQLKERLVEVQEDRSQSAAWWGIVFLVLSLVLPVLAEMLDR
jgi:hypothetical protein